AERDRRVPDEPVVAGGVLWHAGVVDLAKGQPGNERVTGERTKHRARGAEHAGRIDYTHIDLPFERRPGRVRLEIARRSRGQVDLGHGRDRAGRREDRDAVILTGTVQFTRREHTAFTVLQEFAVLERDRLVRGEPVTPRGVLRRR